MSKSSMTCRHCTAATNGVVLCKRCQTTVEVALRSIAADHGALFSLKTPERVRNKTGGEVTDPTGNAAGHVEDTSVETAAADTTLLLVRWVTRLVDQQRTPWPKVTVPAMTTWLERQMPKVVVADWADEFLRELLGCERRLHLIVSRGRGHWYAGICGARTGDGADDWCPLDLFVTPGKQFLRCKGCGTYWSVEQRRAQVIEEARDLLLPVTVIARAAVALLDGQPSQKRLEDRLNQWVVRGLLDDYGVRVLEGRPRRVYRVGDVLDRLAREVRPATATRAPDEVFS